MVEKEVVWFGFVRFRFVWMEGGAAGEKEKERGGKRGGLGFSVFRVFFGGRALKKPSRV